MICTCHMYCAWFVVPPSQMAIVSAYGGERCDYVEVLLRFGHQIRVSGIEQDHTQSKCSISMHVSDGNQSGHAHVSID